METHIYLVRQGITALRASNRLQPPKRNLILLLNPENSMRLHYIKVGIFKGNVVTTIRRLFWNEEKILSPTSKLVINIGFITVLGLNEGHIAPYTDIEFRLTKYQKYIIMKSWYKSLQLIFEETITLLTKIKHVKTDGIKNISQHDKIKVV